MSNEAINYLPDSEAYCQLYERMLWLEEHFEESQDHRKELIELAPKILRMDMHLRSSGHFGNQHGLNYMADQNARIRAWAKKRTA